MQVDASSIILRVVQWILFIVGVLSLVIGMAVVHTTSKQEARKQSQNALVQSGEIEPVDAVMTGKRIDERTSRTRVGTSTRRTTSTTKDYRIVLQIGDSESLGRTVNRSDYRSIQEGEIYDAYPIDGRYFIPRFDSKTHGYVKWIIFSLSTIPMLGAIALLITRMTMAFRARSQETQRNPNIP